METRGGDPVDPRPGQVDIIRPSGKAQSENRPVFDGRKSLIRLQRSDAMAARPTKCAMRATGQSRTLFEKTGALRYLGLTGILLTSVALRSVDQTRFRRTISVIRPDTIGGRSSNWARQSWNIHEPRRVGRLGLNVARIPSCVRWMCRARHRRRL